MDLNPSALDALQELAQIASQRGDTDLLANVADKAITVRATFPRRICVACHGGIEPQLDDKAEANLKTAMSIAPQDPQAYLQLGRTPVYAKTVSRGCLAAGTGIAI